MNDQEYLTERLDEQIKWYSTKSQSNQKYFKNLRLIEIVAAAAIPFLTGMGEKIYLSSWIVGTLGITIAISAATISLYKFHENWIQYRSTCEQLKHEKYLFLTKTKPYDRDDSLSYLVQRVEGLISKENSQWAQVTKKKENTIKKHNN